MVACIHACVCHTYTSVCIPVCVCLCVGVCVYVCVWACMCVCMCVGMTAGAHVGFRDQLGSYWLECDLGLNFVLFVKMGGKQ